MIVLRKRVETYLQNRSEIVYVYPAIPCFIVFIVTIISSSLYITRSRFYSECIASDPQGTDYLKAYVLGSIIDGYVFLGIYSNILIEYIPRLKGVFFSFILLVFWTVGSLIWNIIGASLVSKSHCVSLHFFVLFLTKLL